MKSSPPAMKRSSRPPVLDPPRPSPRRRVLSEEDRELWELVAKQVKPLRKHRATKVHAAAARRAFTCGAAAKPALSPRPLAATAGPASVKAGDAAARPARQARAHELSRGRSEIEARLDLHGMTQMRAHRALSGFLHRAHHDGLTFVLVITGKGERRRKRRAASAGAGMAEPAGIPRLRGRVRGGRISAMAARARFTCGSGGRRLSRTAARSRRAGSA